MDKKAFLFKGSKPVFAGLGLLTVIQGVIIISQAYYLAKAISSLFWGDLFRDVIDELAFFLFALITRQLLAFLKKNIAYHFAAHTSKVFREKLLQKLFALGPQVCKRRRLRTDCHPGNGRDNEVSSLFRALLYKNDECSNYSCYGMLVHPFRKYQVGNHYTVGRSNSTRLYDFARISSKK